MIWVKRFSDGDASCREWIKRSSRGAVSRMIDVTRGCRAFIVLCGGSRTTTTHPVALVKWGGALKEDRRSFVLCACIISTPEVAISCGSYKWTNSWWKNWFRTIFMHPSELIKTFDSDINVRARCNGQRTFTLGTCVFFYFSRPETQFLRPSRVVITFGAPAPSIYKFGFMKDKQIVSKRSASHTQTDDITI